MNEILASLAWQCHDVPMKETAHKPQTHPLVLDREIKLICFDAGFTLIEPHPPVGKVYARVASRFGYTIDSEWLEKRFFETYSQAIERLEEDDPAPFNTSEKQAREWWQAVVRKTFGNAVDKKHMDDLCEALFEEYALANCWKMCRGVPEVLIKMRSIRPDIRLAVLSNWDARIVSVFKDLELARYFDGIFYSADIGYEKPDHRAFGYLTDAFEIQPDAMLHIGDSLEDDARGALSFGARALLVKRSRQSVRHKAAGDADMPCEVLESLEDLVDLKHQRNPS